MAHWAKKYLLFSVPTSGAVPGSGAVREGRGHPSARSPHPFLRGGEARPLTLSESRSGSAWQRRKRKLLGSLQSVWRVVRKQVPPTFSRTHFPGAPQGRIPATPDDDEEEDEDDEPELPRRQGCPAPRPGSHDRGSCGRCCCSAAIPAARPPESASPKRVPAAPHAPPASSGGSGPPRTGSFGRLERPQLSGRSGRSRLLWRVGSPFPATLRQRGRRYSAERVPGGGTQGGRSAQAAPPLAALAALRALAPIIYFLKRFIPRLSLALA